LFAWLKKIRPDAVLTTLVEVPAMIRTLGHRIPQDIAVAGTSVADFPLDTGLNQPRRTSAGLRWKCWSNRSTSTNAANRPRLAGCWWKAFGRLANPCRVGVCNNLPSAAFAGAMNPVI